MLDTAPLLLPGSFPALRRGHPHTLQVNLGYLYNQSCQHCHVNAGPARTELMSRETVDEVLALLERSDFNTLDLTGGAPELNPEFRYLVEGAHRLEVKVMDRCNLTVLLEPGQEELADFLAQHRVHLVSSLPCYLKENVDRQRGKGVYDRSLQALRLLNGLGYGREGSGLLLDLVFNPSGPALPASQEALERDYRKRLMEEHGIRRCPPWRAKRRRVVPGSREATRDTRRAEGAKGDPKGASERGVQSYGRPVCSRNELAMLWRNAG